MRQGLVRAAARFLAARLSCFAISFIPCLSLSLLRAGDDEEIRAEIYSPGSRVAPEGEPLRLGPGPHLLIDDFLIARTSNLKRTVNPPRRRAEVPNPLVTGKEDGCFQPYLSVLRDPASGRFRIWYGHRTDDSRTNRSRLGYMESEDGIRWIRPSRVLPDPDTIEFGVSILDEGPGFSDPARRFKYGWYHGGLRVAASSDGLEWKPLASGVVLPHDHDINGITFDPLRRRYVATISSYREGKSWPGRRRVTLQSASKDLVSWQRPHLVLYPDARLDPGETQFYAMDGFLVRGPLWIGMVKVLRDDLSADDPPEGRGIGYTTLAWSRDGERWVRDQEKFLDRDPRKGAWDHAHAWIDEQLIVGSQVYLYYGGYARGHKENRFEERQIGLLTMDLDRYVAREALPGGGQLETPPLVLPAVELSLNADARGGEVRVEVLDGEGRPVAGFGLEDCMPVSGDSLAAPVRWKRPLGELSGRSLRLRFVLRDARLFAFNLAP